MPLARSSRCGCIHQATTITSVRLSLLCAVSRGGGPPNRSPTTVIAQDLNGVLAANGSAVAAYVDPTLTPGHLWAHRWDGFWSAPVELGPSTDSTHPPAVTIDSTGHAWAAWAEAGSALLLSDSTPDAAWSTPTRLVESPGSGLLGTVSIAANDAGHILLGYSDSSVDLDGPHVFALLGDGSVWAPPVDNHQPNPNPPQFGEGTVQGAPASR